MPVNQVQLEQMNAQAMTPEEQAVELRRKMEELQAQRMAEEQAGIDAYNQQVAQYEQEPTRTNWAPLSAAVADVTGVGKNVAQYLQANAPESADEKRKNLAAMKMQLQTMKSGLSKSQFDAMKDRLESLNKKSESPLTEYIRNLQAQKSMFDLAEKKSAKEEKEREKKSSPLAGYKKTIEDKIDPTAARQIRGAQTAVDNFNMIMDSLKQRVAAADQVELANPYSDTSKAIQQDLRDLQLQYKNEDFAKLGVLAGPDLDMLEKIIENPSKLSNVLSGKKGVLDRYGQLQEKVNKGFQNKLKTYGLEKESKPSATPSSGSGLSPEEQAELDALTAEGF